VSSTNVIDADDQLLAELDEWLATNWDPDLTVAEWWERLGQRRVVCTCAARGLLRARPLAHRCPARPAAHRRGGGPRPPAGLGLVAGCADHRRPRTREQIDAYVRDIVTGQRAWCQLFSEPSAGSDLAGIQTRAVADGEEWVVNGQKVWTSGGQYADYGMLLARTDADVPKHQGISYFAFRCTRAASRFARCAR